LSGDTAVEECPASARRRALAEAVARRAREVALATLSGDTAVEVAIVDRAGRFLARVGTWTAQGVGDAR
jgi:hypothetical protein